MIWRGGGSSRTEVLEPAGVLDRGWEWIEPGIAGGRAAAALKAGVMASSSADAEAAVVVAPGCGIVAGLGDRGAALGGGGGGLLVLALAFALGFLGVLGEAGAAADLVVDPVLPAQDGAFFPAGERFGLGDGRLGAQGEERVGRRLGSGLLRGRRRGRRFPGQGRGDRQGRDRGGGLRGEATLFRDEVEAGGGGGSGGWEGSFCKELKLNASATRGS